VIFSSYNLDSSQTFVTCIDSEKWACAIYIANIFATIFGLSLPKIYIFAIVSHNNTEIQIRGKNLRKHFNLRNIKKTKTIGKTKA
jgi:hypothetical protein